MCFVVEFEADALGLEWKMVSHTLRYLDSLASLSMWVWCSVEYSFACRTIGAMRFLVAVLVWSVVEIPHLALLHV